jgi:hypothetical protein
MSVIRTPPLSPPPQKYETVENELQQIKTTLIPLTHKYITAHFSGLLQALQKKKVTGLN